MKRQLALTVGLLTGTLVFAQTPYGDINRKPDAYRAHFLGITPPLGTLPVATQIAGSRVSAERENFSGKTSLVPRPASPAVDPVWQDEHYRQRGGGNPLTIINNFDGIDEALSTIYPADPTGDIGANHYIQMVNASDGFTYGFLMNVYDKNGNLLYGPTFSSGLWTSIGYYGTGDPIVLYDHDADRWLISEMGADFASMLVAVSATSDPLGAWYAYRFTAPDLPDYPKYAMWPNAYLVTTDEGFNGGDSPVYAFDRQAMINGDTTIKVLRFGVPSIPAITVQILNAADWEGPLPPATVDPIIMRLQDNAWGIVSQDQIEMWSLHIDWANLGNSQLVGPNPLLVSPFDASACYSGWQFCVPQPGGSWLSAIDGFLLYRVYYRKFPGYEAMVCCHLADVNGSGHTGIRWCELRNGGSGWQVHDEGTYAPDTLHRVHASICMDAKGSIALGYMRTGGGPTDFPSLYLTGRRMDDPPGVMSIPETLVAGSAYANWLGRSGDYSAMTLDPTNQAEFWYTGQYFPDQYEWATRVTSFRIASDSHDIGPVLLETPLSSASLGAAEPVTVRLWNYGISPETGFEVSYRVNGSAVQTETVSATVNPGTPYTYTFAATADCSAPGGIYDFEVFTSLSGDGALWNDTIQATVSNLSTSVSEPGGENLAVVYPNPASGDLHVVLMADASEIGMQFIGAGGEQVLSIRKPLRAGHVNTLSLDLNTLPAGVYLLKLTSGERQQTIKVVRSAP